VSFDAGGRLGRHAVPLGDEFRAELGNSIRSHQPIPKHLQNLGFQLRPADQPLVGAPLAGAGRATTEVIAAN
jgi:hypothetical protein